MRLREGCKKEDGREQGARVCILMKSAFLSRLPLGEIRLASSEREASGMQKMDCSTLHS